MRTRRILCLAAAALSLIACKSRPLVSLPTSATSISCNSIVDVPLQSNFVFQIPSAEIGKWIRDNFPNADLSGVGNGPDYHWSMGERAFSALKTRNDPDRVDKVTISFKPYPKISDVTRCFGKPKSYYFGPALDASDAPLMLILWYPDKGFAFYQIGVLPNQAQTNPADVLLTNALLTLPGDEKSIAQKLYLEPFAAKIRDQSLPWPERIDQLRFVIKR